MAISLGKAGFNQYYLYHCNSIFCERQVRERRDETVLSPRCGHHELPRSGGTIDLAWRSRARRTTRPLFYIVRLALAGFVAFLARGRWECFRFWRRVNGEMPIQERP